MPFVSKNWVGLARLNEPLRFVAIPLAPRFTLNATPPPNLNPGAIARYAPPAANCSCDAKCDGAVTTPGVGVLTTLVTIASMPPKKTCPLKCNRDTDGRKIVSAGRVGP